MAQSNETFDLIVVGAGPAGAAAAVTARRAGLSVALIDKASFPRDKLCGGLVSGRSLSALDRIFGARPSRDLFLISRQVDFVWKGKPLVSFRAPYDLWFTMRCDFDHALFRAALASGAADFSGQRWSDLDDLNGRITLESGKQLVFRALIAADGVTSPVASQLFGRAYDPQKVAFAYEVECPPDPDHPNRMVVDFAAVIWGYGWRFPKRNSLTIGVGGLQVQNPNLREMLQVMLPDIKTPKVKGAFLPFGDFRRDPGWANILLAGDAAGLVDPLTGEGIAYALESGEIAAKCVVQALSDDKPKKAASDYKRALKPIHGELKRAVKLRQFAFSPRFETVFREKLESSSNLRQLFFDLLEGKAGYRDIEKRIAAGLMNRLSRGVGLWPGAGRKD